MTNWVFASRKLNEDEVRFVSEANFECQNCGKSVFEMYDFPVTNSNGYKCLCEDCFNDLFTEICQFCGEGYEPKLQTEKHICTIEDIENFKKGLYKIVPVNFEVPNMSDDYNVELVKEVDINKMYKSYYSIDAEYEDTLISICNDCIQNIKDYE